MTKIFALGVTGYIGGDAFYAINQAHPEYEWTSLVRNSDKGALVAKEYPKTKLVYGDLDSYDLIKEEAAKADIVLNWANADHEGAAKAIIAGLSQRSTSGFYIHTSGAGILLFNDLQISSYGNPSNKIYDDLDGIATVTSLPDTAPHRNVDKTVLAAHATSANIHTAIVSPPCIYGPGRGPGNQRSFQVPELTRGTLQRRQGFQVLEGQAQWNEVHVQDLSQVYLRLTEEATKPEGGEATWGPEGYYFAESGEFAWGDVSQAIVVEARKQGFEKIQNVVSLDKSEVEKIHRLGPALWGCNSRSRALRARKVLGWEPKMPSLVQDIPRNVEFEAKSLGLIKGHAAVAAGEV